jgi:histone deacetylase complex regulatory component SIN3
MVADVRRALEFINEIKKVYGTDSREYRDFITVLRDFRNGR